ncbi:MAG: hypothetical protein HY841_05790 [Bacteroidetes bacterium]|nr:hypothetical protein [Bacteroidota bacterium]
MSIAIVDIPNKNLNVFRKLMKALDAKISVVKDHAEYEKKLMLKLIVESDHSEDVSEEEMKKYFRKHGVEL